MLPQSVTAQPSVSREGSCSIVLKPAKSIDNSLQNALQGVTEHQSKLYRESKHQPGNP